MAVDMNRDLRDLGQKRTASDFWHRILTGIRTGITATDTVGYDAIFLVRLALLSWGMLYAQLLDQDAEI